jgi:hypothetical protein
MRTNPASADLSDRLIASVRQAASDLSSDRRPSGQQCRWEASPHNHDFLAPAALEDNAQLSSICRQSRKFTPAIPPNLAIETTLTPLNILTARCRRVRKLRTDRTDRHCGNVRMRQKQS